MTPVNFGDERLPPRFWDKVSPEPNSGCWLWTGSVAPGGYGQFWLGKLHRCTRLVFAHLLEVDPGEMHVLHRCDNPPCCNPDHLRLGSHSDNMLDMHAKGRVTRGHWKTMCKRGHPRTPENLKGNECRECRRARQRAGYVKEVK